MGADDFPFRARDEAISAFSRHVSKGKADAFKKYDMNLMIGRREGIYIYDAYSDRRWINCHCNGGVFNLGHRHPRVVGALRDALDRLDIGNHHLMSPFRAELAQRLSRTFEHALPGVVFGVSGGETIDLAIKVSRAVTGRHTVVSAIGGYHGHTGLAMAAGDPQYRDPYGPNLPGFVQVRFNDLDAMAGAVGRDVAAVLLETIPATLGMPIPEPGFLAGVRGICDRAGAKLILDEVQTGLGRTGRTWCVQHEGIAPDILVTGKGLSGGIYPITAALMTREVHGFFDDNPFIHISTFGGADLGCAAGLTVLDIIEEPGFMARVLELSDMLANGLAGLPFEIRRRGLMMGLKFGAEGAGMMAAKLLYDAGVFSVWANNDTSVLQFLPPLIMSDAEADELVGLVRGAFS